MPKVQQPYVQVAVFHDSATGKRVAVSLMWVTTIHETETGTVFTFLNATTQSVQASFDDMSDMFAASLPREMRRQ